MKIAVDVRALKDNSGVTRHLKTFLDKLQLLDQENEYFLLSNRKITYTISNPKWKLVSDYSFVPGTMWIQLFLPFQLKKLKIDLFWAACQICPIVNLKCKVILSVYDLVYKHYSKTMRHSVRIISQLLIPLSMKKADTVIVSSDFIKKDILETYKGQIAKEKIVVIPCGSPEWVVTEEMRNLPKENYLLFVGNLEPRKNLVNLLSAIEILYNKGVVIPLHIVGPSGWKNSKIMEKLLNSPINNQVSLTGYLSEADLITEYIKCKAVMFPSIYEGFGLPILEALYLDKPVITSKGSSMEEIAQDCAIYVDPKDVNCIASEMMKLFSDNPQPIPSLQHTKSIVNSFSWKKSAYKMMNIFRDHS